MTDGLSAYELERLANIQRNEEQLEALGLGGGVVPQEAKAPRAKKQKREPPPPQEPSRRSSRVRNAPADNVYIADEDDGGKVRLGGRDAAKTAKKVVEEQPPPLTHPDELPISTDDLRAVEKKVWQVLREARNAKAKAMERSMFIVCNDRTLCEMVRVVPTTLDELIDLYGMGEKKVNAHGQMLLDALAPHVDELREEHERARLETPEEAAALKAKEEEEEAVKEEEEAAVHDPDAMPSKPEELLPGERPAYDALVAATHVRAEETGQGKFYWNVAPMRSMCEMVRRVPTTKDELMLCRGLGGAGVKVAKHGDCLLEALRPFVEELRELHEAKVVD